VRLFLDTADFAEIEQGVAWGVVSGVTTNPTLIARAGQDHETQVKRICAIVGDVSAETVTEQKDDLVVEGTGSAHLILHGNGFTLVINGTAEDSDGGTYVFNYHAAGNFNPATSELIFSDHFHLVGNGAANQIKTFFVVKVAFSESGDPIIDAHPLRGDPLWDMNLVLEENEDNVRCDPV